MTYKINEVRSKLGNLMMFILDDEFNYKYQAVASSKRNLYLVASDAKISTDRFIVNIAGFFR